MNDRYSIAPAHMEITEKLADNDFMLDGCGISSYRSKIEQIFVFTMKGTKNHTIDELASIYLASWPNFKGRLKEFASEMKLFNKEAVFDAPFFKEKANLIDTSFTDFRSLVNRYLKLLSAFRISFLICNK